MTSLLQLGPFDLEAPIGEGGMGVVWRGLHRAEGLPVAVKMLRSKRARSKRALAAFRSEVRALAALDHPNVVTVFDQGTVTGEVALASGGRLVEGTPYFVMELSRGHSLRARCGRLSWDETKTILSALLDALAHAHARGVIHRDIKPENVLWDGGERPVLTDFGIAEALREYDALPRRGKRGAGTPAYMAPEQITGRVRDQGPWTDLYALGCLAFDLICGSPPFGSDSGERDILQAHLSQPPPMLEACCGIPEGLESWICRLLQKSPMRRHRKAADASAALESLGPPRPPREPKLHPVDRAASQIGDCGSSKAFDPGEAATVPLDLVTDARAPRLCEDLPKTEPHHPPLPPSWEEQERKGASRRLSGTGLALHGLKPLPLVGRRRERDRLWSALSSVIEERLPRVVLIEGPSGVGKSHLARWLCERADEAGCADVLEAFHGPIPGEAHGLRPMVARALRAEGLNREETRERVLFALAPKDDQTLELAGDVARFLSGAGEMEPNERKLDRRRLSTLGSLLRELAKERQIVLLLDDGQWGLEALSFAIRLAGSPWEGPHGVLSLVTISEEALAEQPVAQAAVAELAGMPRVERLSLGVLDAEEQSELLRLLLGLSEDLAARVERRAGGNPLFAEALVGDWVERGLLVPGEDGYGLAPGALTALPESLAEVWGDRVERALAGWPSEDGEALEIAAILGGRTLISEWRSVCALAGLSIPLDLVESLEAARLVRSLPGNGSDGWTFVHGMVREALAERAARFGRLALRHRQCAKVLAEKPGIDVDERVGSHLLAAGDREEAVAPLTRAARRRLILGDSRVAAAILGDLESILESLGVPPSDPRRTAAWRMWARRERLLGDCEGASVYARQAVAGDEMGGRPGDMALSLIELGRSTREAGRPNEAESYLLKAMDAAEMAGDEDALARCHQQLGWLCMQAARLQEASEHLEVARGRMAVSGRLEELGDCMYAQGWLAIQDDRLADARALFLDAEKVFREEDSRIGRARCESSLGDIARLGGDLEEAESWSRRALASYRSLGDVTLAVPLTSLGLVLLERGRWAQAIEHLEAALSTAIKDGREIIAFLARTGLIAAFAGSGEPRAGEGLLAEAEEANQSGIIRHVELARAATLAARLLIQAKETEMAQRMAAVAKAQWLSLNRAEEAERLDELFNSLDDEDG